MNLMHYLENAKTSLFRWEALQEYKVEEDDDLTPWWSFIEEKVAEGVIMQRVRLIKLPLNTYTKDEIESHKISCEKGDDIQCILQPKFSVENFNDFWLIDEKIVLNMNYSDDGEYRGFEVEENQSVLDDYLNFKKELLSHSKSIMDFNNKEN